MTFMKKYVKIISNRKYKNIFINLIFFCVCCKFMQVVIKLLPKTYIAKLSSKLIPRVSLDTLCRRYEGPRKEMAQTVKGSIRA